MPPPGIISYGFHIPVYRLSRELITAAWNTSCIVGSKAVAGADEDSVTMAIQAAGRSLARVPSPKINALFFCSTTAPFAERSNSALIAAALDLPEWCLALDLGGSLRVGTDGIGVAFDLAKAGQEHVLVTVADCRNPEPGSVDEQFTADAAAALIIGTDSPLAIVEAKCARYDDFLDTVRRSRDKYFTSFGNRLSQSRYRENVSSTVDRLLTSAGISKSDISRVILPSLDGVVHSRTALSLGFSADQVQGAPAENCGFAGAAASCLSLCSALDMASPGDRLLVIGYGEGADGFILRVTDHIRSAERMPFTNSHLISLSSYQIYLTTRENLDRPQGNISMSNVFYAKEEQQNIRLHGSKCTKCGLVQFPIAQICSGCGTVRQLKTIALSKCGHVFTYTIDYLYSSVLGPTIMTVVDLDGGGRLYLQMTDARPEEVTIGMPVILTFRRLHDIHYVWKCSPRRE